MSNQPLVTADTELSVLSLQCGFGVSPADLGKLE